MYVGTLCRHVSRVYRHVPTSSAGFVRHRIATSHG